MTYTSGYLTVITDKSAYLHGETVHLSGAAINPSVTWDYTYTTSVGNGLQVQIQIFDSNNNLVNSAISNPSAAGYKNYAYDYTLTNDASLGTYGNHVTYPFMNLNGDGSFTVYQMQTIDTTVTTTYVSMGGPITTTYATTVVTPVPELAEVSLAFVVTLMGFAGYFSLSQKADRGERTD